MTGTHQHTHGAHGAHAHRVTLAERQPGLREVMDLPGCDPVKLARTLRRFAVVNRLVACWGAVYVRHVRPLLTELARQRAVQPARLLDIGCGAGDVARQLVRLARRDGFDLRALGIDPDPRAIAAASAARPLRGVAYRCASSGDLVRELRGAHGVARPFDIVISNHLMHHLNDSEFGEVLSASAELSQGLCLHSDIARSRLAFAAYAVGITPLTPGSLLRVDGLRSIRRSFTRRELEAQLAALQPPERGAPDGERGAGWHVEQPGRFRLLAVHRPG